VSNSPHYLYQLRAIRAGMLTEGPTDDESAILAEHFDYLMKLAAAGRLSLVGRTANNDESTFGLVIINSGDEACAREIMENDPAIKGMVMTAALFPFNQVFPADQ
jgi:uncharacterized protein YciI